MNPAPPNTEYHPRWFRRRVSTWWWLGEWRYLKFVLREISSVSVAWFVGITLGEIHAISSGQQAFLEFQGWLRQPLVLTLNLISFFFVVFHTVTWFNAAPRAMAVRIGGQRVAEPLIVAANYAAWAAATAVVAWFILRG